MLVDFPRGLGLAFRCFHEGFWNSLQCLTVFSEDSFDLLSDACWFSPRTQASPQCLFGIPWAVVFPSMLVWYSMSCGLPLDACLVFPELWSSPRCLFGIPWAVVFPSMPDGRPGVHRLSRWCLLVLLQYSCPFSNVCWFFTENSGFLTRIRIVGGCYSKWQYYFDD